MMFCKYCGTKVDDDSRFCKNCAKPFAIDKSCPLCGKSETVKPSLQDVYYCPFCGGNIKSNPNLPVAVQKKVVVIKKPAATKAPSSIKDRCEGLKVGQIANTILRQLLESDKVSDVKVNFYSDKSQPLDKNDERYIVPKGHTKHTFGINHPLLRKTTGNEPRPDHYYEDPVRIRDEYYFICCEWYVWNRDRLIRWIEENE